MKLLIVMVTTVEVQVRKASRDRLRLPGPSRAVTRDVLVSPTMMCERHGKPC